MARWAPQRRDTIRALADELLQNYSHGRILVGIDGADGSGKTVFADDLATELRSRGHEAFRASMDDFQRPRALRYAQGRHSADGFYEDSFDYSAFRRVLLGPFRLAGSTGFQLRFFDLKRDVPFDADWTTGPADAFLIVDGLFLLRPELAGIWNFSVWLDAPTDGLGQERYQREVSPRTAASAIIDNTDHDHPRRIFADSC